MTIGFGSMVTLDFIPIRDFGLLTAFGDMVGVLAALYVLPASSSWSGKRKNLPPPLFLKMTRPT